jgi:hypothetical protein
MTSLGLEISLAVEAGFLVVFVVEAMLVSESGDAFLALPIQNNHST